jgi:hypothetical protein
VTAAAEPAPREHGWRRLLLALVVFLFVPAIPPLRAALPIEQTYLLLGVGLAACSWLGWRDGGRLPLALLWSGVAVWLLFRPMAGSDEYGAFARAWALIIGASFGTVGLFTRGRPFFPRALVALAGALVVCVVALSMVGSGLTRLGRVVSTELSDRVELTVGALRARTATPEWVALERDSPRRARAATQMMEAVEDQLHEIAPVAATLFLATLGFETLAALGLAWSLYHRLTRARIGPPLSRFREFRFDDQLVWGVVAGLLMVLVPRLVAWKTLGLNLLAFFGALYGLRGLGVMIWLLVAPLWLLGLVVVTLVIGFFLPLWTVPVGLGLGDTWWNLRRRLRPTNQGSSK